MSRLVTYKCTSCNRLTTFPDNPKGFSTLGSCNITKNCTGKLVTITKKEATLNPKAKIYPNDLIAWYPRRGFFMFTQIINQYEWLITHNLNAEPLIIPYDTNGNILEQFDIQHISRNQSKLIFVLPTAGKAHCIVRTSQSDIDIEQPVGPSPTVNIAPNGFFSVVSLVPVSQSIVGSIKFFDIKSGLETGTIKFKLFGKSVPGQISLNGIDWSTVQTKSANRPWSTIEFVRFNGRRYNVRYVDLSKVLLNYEKTYFQITFDTNFDTAILTANLPYQLDDNNYDSIIPVKPLETVYNTFLTSCKSNQLYIDKSFVKPVADKITKTI